MEPPAVKILTDSDTLQTELSVMTVTSERSDLMPTAVSVRTEITEKWMDWFVVDLVECPSVSKMSAVARTFGSAMFEEYSPVVFAGGGGGCRYIPPGGRRVRLSSGVWPMVGRVRYSSGVCPTVGWVRYSASVCPAYFPAVFLGKVAFDAVGLGVGPPCLRVDSLEALLKRTDERAPLARAAPGVTPEKKLVTKSWMVGRQETMNGVERMKYVPQMTASVWMPFKQTCNEESGDADFDSFKTAPWDAGGTQSDKFHEVMCRAMVQRCCQSCNRSNCKM